MQLMLKKVKEHEADTLEDGHIVLQLLEMGRKMIILAGGGALVGLVAGVITTVRSSHYRRVVHAIREGACSFSNGSCICCCRTQRAAQ
jgi:hypothetical protein